VIDGARPLQPPGHDDQHCPKTRPTGGEIYGPCLAWHSVGIPLACHVTMECFMPSITARVAEPAPISISHSLAAYERLRDWLLGGVLPAGSIIQERRLADELGFSRTPVREALQRLEGEGRASSSPVGRGSFPQLRQWRPGTVAHCPGVPLRLGALIPLPTAGPVGDGLCLDRRPAVVWLTAASGRCTS